MSYKIPIPVEIDDSSLNVYEFRVYIRILRRGKCFESRQNIANSTQMSKPQVIKVVKHLLEQGFITEGYDKKSSKKYLEAVTQFTDLAVTQFTEQGKNGKPHDRFGKPHDRFGKPHDRFGKPHDPHLKDTLLNKPIKHSNSSFLDDEDVAEFWSGLPDVIVLPVEDEPEYEPPPDEDRNPYMFSQDEISDAQARAKDKLLSTAGDRFNTDEKKVAIVFCNSAGVKLPVTIYEVQKWKQSISEILQDGGSLERTCAAVPEAVRRKRQQGGMVKQPIDIVRQTKEVLSQALAIDLQGGYDKVKNGCPLHWLRTRYAELSGKSAYSLTEDAKEQKYNITLRWALKLYNNDVNKTWDAVRRAVNMAQDKGLATTTPSSIQWAIERVFNDDRAADKKTCEGVTGQDIFDWAVKIKCYHVKVDQVPPQILDAIRECGGSGTVTQVRERDSESIKQKLLDAYRRLRSVAVEVR